MPGQDWLDLGIYTEKLCCSTLKIDNGDKINNNPLKLSDKGIILIADA